jgi:hypothetical protein
MIDKLRLKKVLRQFIQSFLFLREIKHGNWHKVTNANRFFNTAKLILGGSIAFQADLRDFISHCWKCVQPISACRKCLAA